MTLHRTIEPIAALRGCNQSLEPVLNRCEYPVMGSEENRVATDKHRTWFKKGNRANPHGRPKGTPNKASLDAKEYCTQLVDNPAYRAALAKRLEAGTAGAVETLVWHYAKGKPVERLEQGGPGAFADVPDEELRRRLVAALEKL